MTSQTLAGILTPDPARVSPEASVAGVLERMESRHISCVLVVDEENHPVGIFTERDAVRLMAEGKASARLHIGEVMRQPVFTVAADLDYRDAYRLMSARGYRHLVVVDGAGKLAGIVSEGDFMHHLGMEYLVELKTVTSAMTPDPVTLGEDASLSEAVALMARRRIGCILVTRDEAPVGVLTERDLVHLARSELDPGATLLAQVMHGPVHGIDAASPLQEAANRMRAAGIRRLAVVEGHRLIGLVTRHDIVKSLHGRYIEYLHETIQRQCREMEQAKDQIRAVRERLRGYGLMEQVSDAIFVIDTENASLIEVNGQACQSLGYTHEALLALEPSRIFSTFPDLAAWRTFRATLRARGRLSLETGLRRHDGGLLPVQIHARLIEDEGREYVVAAARDLSRVREQDAQLQLQIHALNAAANAIILTDTAPRILWANAAFTKLTGYSLAEAIGRKPAELLKSGNQDRPYYQHMWETILAGRVWHGELVNKRKDGSLYDEELTITPVSIAGAAVTHFVAIKQDISARKANEAALRESEERFRLLYERSPVAYQSLDAEGRILDVNQAWLTQLGYPRESVIGCSFGDFLAPGQKELMRQRFSQFLATGTVHGADFDMLDKDGELVVFEVDGRVGRDASGRFIQTHCVLHNITERKALERRLVHLATTDPLTSLANRRHFLDQMTLALARHKRHDTHTALLMLDLDWFKTVNDRHGHAVGDEVLRHAATVMTSSLRRIDLLGRLGGEEFAILLPDTDADGAHEFAERLRQQVATRPARTGSGDISITLSIGVTRFAPQDNDIDAILARADRALYRAKENGRNQVELEPLP